MSRLIVSAALALDTLFARIITGVKLIQLDCEILTQAAVFFMSQPQRCAEAFDHIPVQNTDMIGQEIS